MKQRLLMVMLTMAVAALCVSPVFAQATGTIKGTCKNMDGTPIAGATVEWTNDDPSMPHTITFGTEPAAPFPPSSNVSPDPDGALHATINSTSDSVHSGFIVSAPQDQTALPQTPLGSTRFRVTFTNPGVYPYICALHDDLGMKGTIIVLP